MIVGESVELKATDVVDKCLYTSIFPSQRRDATHAILYHICSKLITKLQRYSLWEARNFSLPYLETEPPNRRDPLEGSPLSNLSTSMEKLVANLQSQFDKHEEE